MAWSLAWPRHRGQLRAAGFSYLNVRREYEGKALRDHLDFSEDH